MKKRLRVYWLPMLLVLLVSGLAGCASDSGKDSAADPASGQPAVTAGKTGQLVEKITPMLGEAVRINKETKDVIRSVGYREITPAAGLQRVIKLETRTEALKTELEALDTTPEVNRAVGDLVTSLYLKQQNLAKLKELLQQPNPKSSALNQLLTELQGSEGFVDKAQAGLRNLSGGSQN